MSDVSRGEGRTVLFVSHNMGAVNQLCKNAILLEKGFLNGYDLVSKITTKYLNAENKQEALVDLSIKKRIGNGAYKFTQVGLKNNLAGQPTREFSIGESVYIQFRLNRERCDIDSIRASVELKASDGMKLANMIDSDSDFSFDSITDNSIEVVVALHDIRLYPDTYYISLYVGDTSSTEIYDYLEDCISFDMISGGNLTTRPLPKSGGLLFLTPDWQVISHP